MTASRELNVPRASAVRRPSFNSGISGGMASSRPAPSRPHSHSLSVGNINQQHRVTRRKSMSNTAVTNAAVVAALAQGESVSLSSKRSALSKVGAGPRGSNASTYGSSLPPSQSPLFNGPPSSSTIREESVVVDGPPLSSMAAAQKLSKSKTRRASEGSRLSKGEGKRVPSGAELRCETCGKGYKHSSCLTKHLWEHTPEWSITSKLLISKHQQVQMLEAASVLVTMTQDAPGAGSDHSSASPAASGSSDQHDDESISTSYTPPPQQEDMPVGSYASRGGFGHARLESTGSSAYSQSYNSVFSDNGSSGRPYVSHYRQWSSENRPSTSGTSYDEEADLTAAVNLLSCSYGTPQMAPVVLSGDVPPVPPLPAKFLGQNIGTLSGSTIQPTPQQRGNWAHRYNGSPDVDMDEDSEGEAEREKYKVARARSDEDEGVFGTMEE